MGIAVYIFAHTMIYNFVTCKFFVQSVVDGELIGEYTLSQSKPLRGDLALTVLSGTNKDYGTRCEVTDLRVWTPNE